MLGQRLTRRSLVAGAALGGVRLVKGHGLTAARQTPVGIVASADYPMAGADAANTNWVIGPARDGVPQAGERLLPEYAFSRALLEDAGMLAQDGVIYARGQTEAGDGVLCALDAASGSPLWQGPGADALLALAPGVAIVQRLGRDDAPDFVAAVEIDGTGADRWRVETRAWGRTVVVGDRVLVSTGPGPLAIDVTTGTVVWERLDVELAALMDLAVGDGIVVGTQPTEADRIRAWRLDTGEPLWSVALDRPVQTAPLVAGDAIVVCDPLELIELDLRTGEERWRVELGRTMTYRGRLALAGTTVIVSDIGGLSAIDRATGETRWMYVPRFGTSFGLQLAGATAYLLVNDSTSIDAMQVVQAIGLDTGEPRWEAPLPGSVAAADDIRQLLVTGDRLWLASMNGLRLCPFTDLPDPGVSGAVQGNTFASEAMGFSYSWTDGWEPGATDWLLGDEGLRLQSVDGEALVTQYVQGDVGQSSPDEVAWAIAGVPPEGQASLDPAPLVAAFPRTFGPDTRRLRELEAVAPPDLTGMAPAESGVAEVLARTTLNPPFDRMLVLIVAIPLRVPGTLLVFEFAAAADAFDARLPAFLAFFEHLEVR